MNKRLQIWNAFARRIDDMHIANVNECGIYIYLIGTKQAYIGQSNNIRRRLVDHYVIWDKLGIILKKTKAPVKILVLEICKPDELNTREDYWIEYYKDKKKLINVKRGNRI
jgi:predicted GIY-YIG superfamily endonuclease